MVERFTNGRAALAECLYAMGHLKDKSIDMILCDLPYGTTRNKWDVVVDPSELWAQYDRITKPTSNIILFGQGSFAIKMAASNLSNYRYEIIWEKDRATGHLNSKKRPMNAHENILVFYRKFGVFNPQKSQGHKPANKTTGIPKRKTENYGDFNYLGSGGHTDRYPRTVLKQNVINSLHGPIHPTQKPAPLFEYLIKTYSNPGDVILDNCAGSFTTAIAAENTGRRWICFENNEDYFKMGIERIKKHLNQEVKA